MVRLWVPGIRFGSDGRDARHHTSLSPHKKLHSYRKASAGKIRAADQEG
jgi:hypothetical protein